MEYSIKEQRFYLDGEPLPLFSGSCQYWRIDPSLWSLVLERVVGMGFHLVETYIPWSVHEVARGRFEFSGGQARDLEKFLMLCSRTGLKVLARPGPHINAEMTYFGYPERLLADLDIAMRCADNTPAVVPTPPRMFPAPCYHHPRFQEEASLWLEAVCAVLRGHLYPRGPVIAVQVDNECSRFFRTHPFDCDYSAHSIRLYRKFLAEKYRDMEALNRAYRGEYTDWALVDPPRAFRPSNPGDLPRLVDWAEFGEYYIKEALKVITGIIRAHLGEGVPLYHNYPASLPLTPFDIAGTEEFLDFQGIDAYPRRTSYHSLRRGVKFASTVSRLPVLTEFGSGGIYFGPPVDSRDMSFTTRAALMHGIRGINFYMLIERERWYGSPVKRCGGVRESRYEFYRQLLREIECWGLEGMRCRREVLLMLPRDYERLASAATIPCPMNSLIQEFTGGPQRTADLFISEDPFCSGEPVPARYARLAGFWYWALTAAGTHFGIGDDSLDPGALTAYRAVIVPTFGFMSEGLQRTLIGYAREGGRVLVGPRAPQVDQYMVPCRVLAKHMREPGGSGPATISGMEFEEVLFFEDGGGSDTASFRYTVPIGEGSLTHIGLIPQPLHSPEDVLPFVPVLVEILEASGIEPSFVPGDPGVDVAVWEGKGRTVVFVANPTSRSLETEVTGVGEGPFREFGTGGETEGCGTFRVSLEPYSIKAFERSAD